MPGDDDAFLADFLPMISDMETPPLYYVYALLYDTDVLVAYELGRIRRFSVSF